MFDLVSIVVGVIVGMYIKGKFASAAHAVELRLQSLEARVSALVAKVHK